MYRVFNEAGDERILRGLDRAATATLEKLLGESFFEALVAGGQVVPTKLLDRASPDAKHVLAAGWSAVVEHDPVDFVTWPYEWPFSMLKDAALLQLQLLETAAKNGWLLKDAHAVQCAMGRHRGQCSLTYRRSFLGRLATTGGVIGSSALLF